MKYGYTGGATLAQRGNLVPSPQVGTPMPPRLHGFNPLGASEQLAPGQPGVQQHWGKFDANRVIQSGGNLTEQFLHPSIIPFEQLYRRLPEEGMFSSTVNPNTPFAFELGAFTVPPKMALALFDLRPDIYRFSGVDAGDYVPVEARRFGSIMGFDLTVDQQRRGEVSFELDPIAIQRTSQQAFQNNNNLHPQANAGQFAIGNTNSFASPSGAGTSLLPQRPTRFGALSIPFTIYARSGQTVQVRCVIFRRMPAAIAFIEYDMAGILIPEYWLDFILQAVKPPQEGDKEFLR